MLFWKSLFVLLPSVVGVPAEQKPLQEESLSPLTAEFDDFVHHVLQHYHVPGLSVAVINGNTNQTWSKVGAPFSVRAKSIPKVD